MTAIVSGVFLSKPWRYPPALGLTSQAMCRVALRFQDSRYEQTQFTIHGKTSSLSGFEGFLLVRFSRALRM